MYMVIYVLGVGLASSMFWGGWYESSWVSADELGEFSLFRGDIGGVALMYSVGGGILVISA